MRSDEARRKWQRLCTIWHCDGEQLRIGDAAVLSPLYRLLVEVSIRGVKEKDIFRIDQLVILQKEYAMR
jgi:hypothetical protein